MRILVVDDYIIKPFETIELIARIEVALRRYKKSDSNVQRVREKLDLKDYIKTVFKIGYRLEE